MRRDLEEKRKGSKSWWARERQLQRQAQRCCSIPALKKTDGTWVRNGQDKADLLAQTLSAKYTLAVQVKNEYTELAEESLTWATDRESVLTVKAAGQVMSGLREDSATGPDKVPTRIIKQCAQAVVFPMYLLATLILRTGRWPALYTMHWVACLHKKKIVFDASNYRGVHMTAQFAKVLERFIGLCFRPTLSCEKSIGSNQFAYSKGRGARDALAYLVLSWLEAFRQKASIALYMSDVSGAFDRVSLRRLIEKLRARGVHATCYVF